MSDERVAPGAGRGPYRRASELASFVYCRRAWWLGRVLGVPSMNRAALTLGTRAHAQVGRDLRLARRNRFLAWCLFLAALTLVLLAIRG